MASNTSIQTAIHLLTAPLLGARSPLGHPRMVSTITNALTKSLIAPKNPNYTITMNLTASKLPPSCILAACFAAGCSWAEWCRLLGGDMFIEIRDDYVTWIGTGMFAPITIQSRRQFPKEEEVVVDDVEMGDHTVSVVPPTPLPGLEFNRAPSPALSSSTASSGGALFSDISRPSSRRTTPAHSRNSSMSSLSSISSTSSSSSQPTVYKYAGGETNVLGGGVKLSANVPAPSVPARRTSSRLAEKENSPAKAMKKDVPTKASRPRAASRATNWRTKA